MSVQGGCTVELTGMIVFSYKIMAQLHNFLLKSLTSYVEKTQKKRLTN